MLFGGEAQAARGGDRHIFQHAGDESDGAGFETFLDRPQRLFLAGRLDEEERAGVEAEPGEARTVEEAGLTSGRPG